mmetsp:Transcript_46893/g.138408  ORF Transcript_46893/g.138408 Transcript_46893/m.138408 type:complete len:90 (-) Transcript_46893:485-754(-)
MQNHAQASFMIVFIAVKDMLGGLYRLSNSISFSQDSVCSAALETASAASCSLSLRFSSSILDDTEPRRRSWRGVGHKLTSASKLIRTNR